LSAERVMRETDPTQKLIDSAIIDRAEAQDREDREETAIFFNNAFVKAFPKQKG
jgi:hypothetical protein